MPGEMTAVSSRMQYLLSTWMDTQMDSRLTDAKGCTCSEAAALFLISKYAPGVFLNLSFCKALSHLALVIFLALYLLYG